MKPEKQQLLDDLLGGHGGREATLAAGTRILRRRRQWRAATRGLVFMSLLALGALWLERAHWDNRSAVRTTARAVVPPGPIQPRALTDAELLALFPDTPVGLATLSDGRKRLIFPRPGDEQKFITRL